MAFRILSRVCTLKSSQTAFSALSSAGSLKVEHDRRNQRFTVTAGSSAVKSWLNQDLAQQIAADHECAVLKYRFTGEKEVDLMSTFVPETYRGRGVAALLSRAALDFVVEENLKAHVSCWYIKKYIEEQPQQRYKDFVIT